MDDFESFFEENYGAVVRTVTVAVGDRGRVEDLTQEAFVRAFRRWRLVSTMQRPVTWVYVVAMNADRRRWRREERESAFDEPNDSVLVDPAGGVVTTIVVREALGRLAPRQCAAVALRYLTDLSIAEVAEVMDCAEGTVKAALHQALRNLRVDLEGERAMNLDEFRETLDEFAGPAPQLTDATRTRVRRGIRRTRRRRRAEAAAVVLVVAAVVVSLFAINQRPAHQIHIANDGGTGIPQAGAGVFPDATGSVLILDDGSRGIVAVDLDHRVAVRRPTPGGLPEEQPTGIVGADDAFFSGANEVYAVPYDGGPAVPLGRGTEFIPAAEPNAIWLLAWSGGREGAGIETYREVDETGAVLRQVNGPDPSIGFPEMGIPGGIAFETGSGVALWDAQTRRVTARLGAAATFVDAVHANMLAWCEDLCTTEHITQIGGRDLRVSAPAGAPNFSARSARFSPDGRYLAAVAGEGAFDESALEIVLIDTRTGAVRVITPRNIRLGVSLAWSPDSRRLFFSPSADANTDITVGEYVVATDQLHTSTVPFWGNLNIAVSRSSVVPLLDAPATTQAACPPPNQAGPTPTCSFHFDLATGSQRAPSPSPVRYLPCPASQLTTLPPEWASPLEQQTDDLVRVTNEGATCQLSGAVSLVAGAPGRPDLRATVPRPGLQPSNGAPVVLPKGSSAQVLVAANNACSASQRYTTLTITMPGGGSVAVTLPQHNVSADPDQNGRDLTLPLAPSCPPTVDYWTPA